MDLRTDSWHESEIPLPPLPGPHHTVSVETYFRELYGFPYVAPVWRGRCAEAILAAALARTGSVVACNALFPTACYHLQSRGMRLVALGVREASNPQDPYPFKGNLDLERLHLLVARASRRPVACVWIEACCNELGGQPISPENLRSVHDLCFRARIPLVLDATRLLENALLCAKPASAPRGRFGRELWGEYCSHADYCVMSATKDFVLGSGGFLATRHAEPFDTLQDGLLAFGSGLPGDQARELAMRLPADPFPLVQERLRLVQNLHRWLSQQRVPVLQPAGGHCIVAEAPGLLPHLAPEDCPVEALLAALFLASGVRGGAQLCSPAGVLKNGRWLRLALPLARYSAAELQPVIAAFEAVQSAPERVSGLRLIARGPGVRGGYLAAYRPNGEDGTMRGAAGHSQPISVGIERSTPYHGQP